MKVTVTQEDIGHGIKNNPCHCPVALALIAAGVPNPSVFGNCVWAGDGSFYKLPAEAYQFIADFDQGKLVSPIEFDVENLEDFDND